MGNTRKLPITVAVVALLLLQLCPSLSPAAARMINVQIRAHLPNHLNNLEGLFLTGNHANLGAWEPNAIRLTRVTNNLWQTTVLLPEAKMVEFKFTLGDWDHVETTNQNRDRSNRFVYCTEDCQLNIEVENFRLTPFHPKPSTANGRIQYFHEIYFQQLDNLRSIAVYLPPGYEVGRSKYPVLYAMDGQNLFDNATATFGQEWNLDEVAEGLISRGEIPPMIIVGIYSTEKRSEELLMNPSYANFVVNGVKPFIEKKYRVRKGRTSTGILGSSFGGVFAFYTAWNYSDQVEKFAAMSTAYWWGDLAVENMVSSSRPVGRPLRLWMDMGTQEGGKFDKSVDQMKRVYSIIQKDFPGDLQMQVIDGASHNEKSWGARVGRVLKYLFAN